MNHFLIQGYVSGFTGGDFNNYKKGGIYLFERANGQQFNNAPPTDKGILEVIPSTNFVVQRATAIGAVNSSTGVTGAQYLRSASVSGTIYTWGSWITVSNTGGTISIADSITPTDHSSAVTGYAVAQYVAEQIQTPHDPYVWLELSVNQDLEFTDAILHFTGWTNPVPNTVSDLIADDDFFITFKNTVPLVIGNQLMGQCLVLAPDGWTSDIYFYIPNTGRWNSEYLDGIYGYLDYQNNEWHLAGLNTLIPFWYYEVQDARDYTTDRTSYTNSNPTTMTVGGIPAGTTFDNESLSDIIESLLYPYVAFNFSSFTTTAASGTFEYGTAKSITAVKPTYTKGSKDLTNMKVGTTSGGSNLYNSSVPNSGTSISLSTPLQLNGLSNQTIYTTITDGTTTTTKSVTFSFPQYYYWANTSSTTAPGSLSAANVIRGGSDADGDVSGVQTDNNSYLFFFVPSGQNKSQIQQYAMSQWNNVDTISVGTVTFLTNTNQSVTTYKAYRTSMLVAGSGNRFRIN